MPLQDTHQIVSVDDHLIEHPRVWQDRLPEKFREAGPRIVEVDGQHLWSYDNTLYPTIGLNAVAGKPPEEWGTDPVRYEDMIPGCYDPVARVADMDLDGVQAALCFPSFPGFAGGTFYRGKDRDLALLSVKAWNDFHVDEWCAAAPDRFIPLGILPIWDIDASVAEAERLAAKGVRTVSLPRQPGAIGSAVVPLRSLGRSMAGLLGRWHAGVAALRGRRLCARVLVHQDLHLPGRPGNPADRGPFAVAITIFATNLMWSTVDLLFSGKLQKFPNLQFSLSEGGIGWVPYILERADYVWERHRYYQAIDFDSRPSELFRSHFWGCFIDDEHGLSNRHAIGIDRICLEIDFPHSDSNWPNSRKRAAEVLATVPDDECALIVEDNARRMLNFPRPADAKVAAV